MPTSHLTDDQLVLHYYGELAAVEASEAAAHIRGCPRCAASYARLQQVLGAISAQSFDDAEPPPSFERTVWARLHPELRPSRPGWRAWLRMSPAPLALAAAVVVLVTAAFFAGRALSPHPAPAAASVDPAEGLRERVLLVDLGEHLDRSQMALVELVSAAGEAGTDIGLGQARAEQLVADTRLYRRTAEATGDTGITELLEDIERVLTEVAASPHGNSGRDLEDVRRRIESRDLLFKVRVMSSEIRDRQRRSSERQAGPPS